MKTIASSFVSIAVAFWVSAIAILAVQNADPVSLKFLGFESIKIPFGVLLSICASLGMIGMTILEPILRATNLNSKANLTDEEPDFFTDDEVY